MELSVADVVSESADGAHAMEKAATNKIPVNMAKSLTSESPYPGRAETTYYRGARRSHGCHGRAGATTRGLGAARCRQSLGPPNRI